MIASIVVMLSSIVVMLSSIVVMLSRKVRCLKKKYMLPTWGDVFTLTIRLFKRQKNYHGDHRWW